MSSAAIPTLTKPHFRKTSLSALNADQNQIHGLELAKEHSTLGELISLPKPSDTLTVRRSSLSDLSEGPATVRNRRLSRTDSLEDVTGGRPRRVSFSSDKTPRVLSRANSREDVQGGISRRVSLVADKTPRVSNEDDEPDSPKRKPTRRDSMLNMLREDLEKVQQLPALKKHALRRGSSVDDVFSAAEEEERETSRKRLFSQASFSFPRRQSRLSTSSDEEDRRASSHLLTDSELKKLKMLQTLNKMGVKPPKRSRSDSVVSNTEVAVLEQSMMQGKRGSIAGRILIAASRRQFKRREHAKQEKLAAAIQTAKEEEEANAKLQKSMNLLQKPETILSGLPSRTRGPLTGEEAASEAMGVLKKRFRRKKMKPLQKFRRLAKFLVLLLRAWRIHSNAVNDILANYDSLNMMTNTNDLNNDLMFDVTKFKAVKEAKVSQEAKRILMKKPKLRTTDEIHYIQIALRNYKAIAEYPVKMQRMIAERSWFETYDAKRVIVREGHIPMCFYFILSGSGVVSQLDGDRASTIMFLNRGDSFGDVAILNKSKRQTTVISREKIELLVMGDTDFVDIFMSGGLRDPEDPFLKSISFLNGWPVHLLIEHPKKCIFSFFKRGTVLVNNSNESDWIFVVKSGSCSILKKLQPVDPKKRRPQPKKKDLREEVLDQLKHEEMLSHEEQLQLLAEEEIRELEQQNLQMRYYALPEINVATNDAYAELKGMHEEYINQSSITRALGALEKMADNQEVKSEAGTETMTLSTEMNPMKGKAHRRMSISSLTSMISKGPFLAKRKSINPPSTRGKNSNAPLSASSSRDIYGSGSRESSASHDNERKVQDWQNFSLPSLAESPMRDLRVKPIEKAPVFVNVQTLTKGQVFGLSELLFDGQPSFSFVSNAAECIMIDKKFFVEHASYNQMVRLREATYPYPSDADLQNNLESQIIWDYQKKQTLLDALKDLKIRRIKPHDSRALPEITAQA